MADADPRSDATAIGPENRRRHGDTLLQLAWRPYRFALPRAMVTSQGAWSVRQGWLLRLQAPGGQLGWGEAALPPMATTTATVRVRGPRRVPSEEMEPAGAMGSARPHRSCGADQARPAATTAEAERSLEALTALPAALERDRLEALLPDLPRPLACALGMALAELDGLGSDRQGGWLVAPPSARLLPAGEAAIAALEEALITIAGETSSGDVAAAPLPCPLTAGTLPMRPPGRTEGRTGENQPATTLTVKWKVAGEDEWRERRVLDDLLRRLPADGRLRLDANGGWERATAWRWARRLADEPRLDWLEQPLPPDDREGLEALARTLPVALDESLRLHPDLIAGAWSGWQVRRPLAEGDPRPLLAALRAGRPRLMLSTALETGIGRRFLQHLAGLQALGPTPTAPGLAPGWRPPGALFSREPEAVWEAAG